MERLVVLGIDGRTIGEEELPVDELLGEFSEGRDWAIEDPRHMGLQNARQAFERRYVTKALERCNWNLTDTARLLKVHRNTLMLKVKALNIIKSRPGN